jgi:monothiol glutaredoxin
MIIPSEPFFSLNSLAWLTWHPEDSTQVHQMFRTLGASFLQSKRWMSKEMNSFLHEVIQKNKLLVFIKGTATQPRCGFSKNVINILNEIGVKSYSTVNVLENEELREAIKEHSKWPTIPQVFVEGEFLGGSDILTGMYKSGELKKMFEQKGILANVSNDANEKDQ